MVAEVTPATAARPRAWLHVRGLLQQQNREVDGRLASGSSSKGSGHVRRRRKAERLVNYLVRSDRGELAWFAADATLEQLPHVYLAKTASVERKPGVNTARGGNLSGI